MLLKSNERIVIKRDNTPGVIPTIPTSNDHTDGSWYSTDIYVGEFFMNIADNKLWWRSDTGIQLIYYSGMTSTFVDLPDTPSTYTGSPSLFVKVNSGSTGLEFVDVTIVENTLQLTDMPIYSIGEAGYSLVVNSSGTGYKLGSNISTFIGLTDVPASYSGYSNYIPIVNSAETELEFYDRNLIALKADNNNFIGNNNFSGLTYFYDYATFTDFVMGEIKINEISTIVSSSSTHSQLATSKSIFDYIDNISALSGMSNVAFNNIDNNFSETQSFQNIQIGSSTSYYLGNSGTDGSWRIKINNNGSLQFEKRISGVWTIANTIDVI